MIENLLQNNGLNTALSGLLIVFSGLVIIALVIHLFNRVFSFINRDRDKRSELNATQNIMLADKISEEELAAITVAIELYRKIHFEKLQGKITFVHGNAQSPWKISLKYGKR